MEYFASPAEIALWAIWPAAETSTQQGPAVSYFTGM